MLGAIEYNPYISKGIAPVPMRFIVEIQLILCKYMCGHQKIKNWRMCEIST